MNKLSIIILTYNEEGNIRLLIERISKSLSVNEYEIIFIDDHSTDNTQKIIRKLANEYPIFPDLRKILIN